MPRKADPALSERHLAHFAHFELTFTTVDKPTDRERWNGEPTASNEAREALFAGVDAFKAALRERGFGAGHSTYGVRATERTTDG